MARCGHGEPLMLGYTSSHPTLAYTLTGPEQAPLLVFVNGLGGAQAAFTLQVRDFSRDYRVLTFDHRGMGRSQLVDAPVHMADYAADLIRLLDELRVGSANFVGLSFGGRVVLQLAAGWPERVQSLVVGGTSAGGIHHTASRVDAHATLRNLSGGDAKTWGDQVAPLLFGRTYVQRYPERIHSLARWRARHPVSPVGIARQWEAWDTFDLGDQLEAIEAPALVIHGTDDAISPVENAHTLARLLPRATLSLMDGIGHSPNVESSEAFNAAIRAFIQTP